MERNLAGAVALPRVENGLDGHLELLERVRGKLLAHLGVHLRGASPGLERGARESLRHCAPPCT